MSNPTIDAAKADLNDDPRAERIADMLKRGIPVITE